MHFVTYIFYLNLSIMVINIIGLNLHSFRFNMFVKLYMHLAVSSAKIFLISNITPFAHLARRATSHAGVLQLTGSESGIFDLNN